MIIQPPKTILDVASFQGNGLQNYFAPVTKVGMSRWWLFNELIGKGDASHFVTESGQVLDRDAKREVRALGNYALQIHDGLSAAVYWCASGSTSNHFVPTIDNKGEFLREESLRDPENGFTMFEARTRLSACANSLYMGLNGIVNILATVFEGRHAIEGNTGLAGLNPKEPSEYIKSVHLLNELQAALAHRTQDVHYWPGPIGFTLLMGIIIPSIPSKIRQGALDQEYREEDFVHPWEVFEPLLVKAMAAFDYSLEAINQHIDGVLPTTKGWRIDYTKLKKSGGKRPVPSEVPRTDPAVPLNEMLEKIREEVMVKRFPDGEAARKRRGES